MKRKYPDQPIIGVGGILFQEDQVLLVRRGKEPALGQWSIPGGVVKVGETLREAIVREMLEETHLEVEPLTLVKVLDRIFHEADGRVSYHYVLADFICRWKSGTLRADSDVQDAQFVPLRDLLSYSVAPITLEVISLADRIRKRSTWPPSVSEEISYG